MKNEEWANSTCAPDMLKALYLNDPTYFEKLVPTLHRYFIACCWKIKHFIPQKHLREGLRGAEKLIDGEITDDEFSKLEWHAEGEAFAIDYAKTPEDINEIKALVESIDELQDMPFEQAKKLLCCAAYFVNTTMVYPGINTAPFVKSLCTSEFLCPDFLRQFLQPPLDE